MDRQQALGVMTGLLTAAIRMGQEPRHRAAAAQGPPERCGHQRGIQAGTPRPAHDLARLHIQQDRDVSPPLGGPPIRHIPGPDVLGGVHSTLPGQEVRRHRLAMRTVGRHRPTPRAPSPDPARIPPHPPGLDTPHGRARSVALLGHPSTPIALPRLGMQRFDPREQDPLVMGYPERRVSLGRGVHATPTHRQHRPQHRQRPGLLVLEEKGISPRDALAQKAVAFFTMSRAIRKP